MKRFCLIIVISLAVATMTLANLRDPDDSLDLKCDEAKSCLDNKYCDNPPMQYSSYGHTCCVPDDPPSNGKPGSNQTYCYCCEEPDCHNSNCYRFDDNTREKSVLSSLSSGDKIVFKGKPSL